MSTNTGPDTPLTTIHSYWARLEAREWTAFAELLAPHFSLEWPQSFETLTKDEFLLVNQHYPGDWHIELIKSYHDGATVVTETLTRIDCREEIALSFFLIEDGFIVSLREFWPEPFPIPPWRSNLLSRTSSPST